MVDNYRPFGNHLPTNDIKKFWSVFGRNLVGKLIFKYFFFCHFEFDILLLNIYIYIPTNDIKKFWSVFGRNLVGKLIFKYFFFCHFEFDILLLNIYIYIY